MTVPAIESSWYDLAGSPEKPPVVLIHGSVVSRVSWQMQIESFAGQFRLIMPDLPGHGMLRGEPFSFERAVEMLAGLVSQHAGGPAALVGVSLGGHVAELFAQRYPEMVWAVVISGASMNFHGALGAYVRAAAWFMQKAVKPQRLEAQAVKNMRAKWPSAVVDAQIAAGVAPLGAAQPFQEITRYDFRRCLEQVQCPVLILNGERDRPNRRGEKDFAAACQNGQIEIVPGAGHACNIENPANYNRSVLEFLMPLSPPV
jgi:pimeloyl-ACP methyl ester carboxylesterase